MSSSRLVAVTALYVAACNQVFGIDPTTAKLPIDAQYFDAPLDAPFACPPIGTTPRFSSLLHQPILQPCSDYTLDLIGGAIALCNASPALGISEGARDASMAMANGFIDPTGSFAYPRVTPEGDEVVLTKSFGRSVPGEIHVFERQGIGWNHAYQVVASFAFQPGVRIGTPTAGPVRRIMIIDRGTVYELSFGGDGVAAVLDQYTPGALGLTNLANAPNLSPDGLRLTMTGTIAGEQIVRTVFSDRMTLGERFRLADPIVAFANASDSFMTADCARIYFSAVASVLYVQRE